MEEKKYALRIPRAISTGIVLEAVEKFGLVLDQEKPTDDAFDMSTGLPTKDYVPVMLLRGDSPEILMAAKEYIYKKHEEWIDSLEDTRKMRREQILRKIKK